MVCGGLFLSPAEFGELCLLFGFCGEGAVCRFLSKFCSLVSIKLWLHTFSLGCHPGSRFDPFQKHF